MAERVIRVRILVEAPGAAQAGNEAAGALNKVADSSDKASDKASNAGKIIGTVIVAGALLATKAMLSLGMSYESNLNTLQAVSGASAETMGKVSEAAKKLGNDINIPGASAGDAALAMTELAKGGLSVEQAMSAARGTLQLAAAAQIDGAQAAEIQSAALNTFGLAADQAGRVADVLANVANASSGEISDFAAGMAQSGLAAKSMGVSLEDTATVLGIFANNGLSGSDAGTSFKTMLISLANPTAKAQGALDDLGVTVYDAQGQFVGMESVTQQLADAQGRMTTEQFNAAAATAFGTDAMRAAIALAETGPDGFDAMSDAIGRSGGAAELAAANSKGLQGAIDTVKNAAETAALTMYESLSPALETAVRGIADMIPGLADDLAPALSTVGLAFVDVVNAVLPLIPVLVTALAPAITSAAEAIGSLATDVGPLITTVGEFAGQVLSVAVPALSALATGVADLIGWVTGLPDPILAAGAALGGVVLLAGPAAAALGAIGAAWTFVATTITVNAAVAGGAMALMKAATVATFTNPLFLAAAGAAALAGAIVAFSSDVDDAVLTTTDFKTAVDETTGALKDNAQAVIARQLADSGSLAVIKAAGGDVNLYTSAIAGNADAQKEYKTWVDNAITSTENGTAANSAARDASVAYNRDLIFLNEEIARGQLVTEAITGSTFAFSGSAKEADQSVKYLFGSLDAGATVAGIATPSVEKMGEALDGVDEAAKSADVSLNYLILTLDAAAGRAPDVERATRAVEASLRDYTKELLAQPAALRAVEDAQAAVGTANDAVTQSNIDLVDAQNKQVEKGYTQEQKAIDVAAAQRDVDAASRGVTDATDAYTAAQLATADASDALFESGVTLRNGVIQQAQAAYAASVASGDLTGAQRAAYDTAYRLRDAFVASNTETYGSVAAAEAAADALGLIPGDISVAIDAQDNTKGVRQVIQDFIRTTDGQVITIYTNAITRQSTTTSNVKATEQADGGIWSGGSLTAFASGGIIGSYLAAANGLMRNPMIAKAGSNILWGESETGGESYIPHAMSKRSRSEMLMGKTADILGGQYIPASAVQAPSGIQSGFGGSGSPNSNVSMSPSFDVRVLIGNRDITDIVRVEVNENSAADSRTVRSR